ncbi:MAG: flagellar basal body L-ring protein FlgH [Opitutae bacterium]|nr:flagellar basal body L-ring protein FlgH [Opitutae bacterium]
MKTAFKSASDLRVAGPSGLAAAALIALLALGAADARAASLWTADAGPRGMFADRKASRSGDILTIVVIESVAATNTQSKSSTRKSAVEDAVGQFIFSVAASKLGTHNGELPSTNITGKGDYSGGGQTVNNQSLSSRAAVLVTDVMPNGNLVIEGVRVVTFSGETQYVVLHGLVRPDDIAADNTILSSNIADARVEFVTEGALTDAQKRGWLSKLYEKLRPF